MDFKKARKDLVHELRNGISVIRGQTKKMKKRQDEHPCFRWCKYWRSVTDDELLRMENALADFIEWAEANEDDCSS